MIEEIGVVSEKQRANLIVETLAKTNSNTSRLFINHHSGTHFPIQTDRFIKRNTGIHSRKTHSMSGFGNQL